MSLIHSGSCDGTTQLSESIYICRTEDYSIISTSGATSGSLLKTSSTHDLDSDDEEIGDFITGSLCPECNLFWVGSEVSSSY